MGAEWSQKEMNKTVKILYLAYLSKIPITRVMAWDLLEEGLIKLAAPKNKIDAG